jgi:hypothetical protein
MPTHAQGRIKNTKNNLGFPFTWYEWHGINESSSLYLPKFPGQSTRKEYKTLKETEVKHHVEWEDEYMGKQQFGEN